MLTTAAGTIPPAKVLVLGRGRGGPAGDRHRAPAGRVVQAFDVRSAVKEQIESLGAQFLELDMGSRTPRRPAATRASSPRRSSSASATLLAEAIGKLDAVITTALVPGPAGAAARHRAGGEEHEARAR